MKKFLYCSFVLCIATVMLFGIDKLDSFLVSSNNTVIEWGLSYQRKESTPDIPDRAATMLDQGNGIFVADTSQRIVYLTFDLGYEAGYTGQVLDVLKKYDAKAMFFLCGNYLKESQLITRMIKEGHTIGNHTDKHLDLPKQTEQKIRQDIQQFAQQFDAQYNSDGTHTVKHFRPPFGKFDQRTLKEANALGLKTVLWSNAIADWAKKPIDPKASADKFASRIHNGCIILSHITNSGTPKMLELLIPQLQDMGYVVGNAGSL